MLSLAYLTCEQVLNVNAHYEEADAQNSSFFILGKRKLPSEQVNAKARLALAIQRASDIAPGFPMPWPLGFAPRNAIDNQSSFE